MTTNEMEKVITELEDDVRHYYGTLLLFTHALEGVMLYIHEQQRYHQRVMEGEYISEEILADIRQVLGDEDELRRIQNKARMTHEVIKKIKHHDHFFSHVLKGLNL
jgi:hypothetical protein